MQGASVNCERLSHHALASERAPVEGAGDIQQHLMHVNIYSTEKKTEPVTGTIITMLMTETFTADSIKGGI